MDENQIAAGKDYCDVNSREVSPNHELIAYSVDYNGSETYTISIKNISTGKLLLDEISETDGSIIWDKDGLRLYYFTMDDEHRPNKLFVHTLGEAQSDDVCLFEERDGKFWMAAAKSASDKYLVLATCSSETSEMHILDLS